MQLKNKLFIIVIAFGFFLGISETSYADTISILSDKATAQFSNTNYGSVVFVTPGSLLATNGATPVSITNTQMTGQAWGNYVGWIQFNGTSDQHITVTCNGDTATLSGYGWGENAAWINFGPFTGDAASSQPRVDKNGQFTGAVWSENFGWLDLSQIKSAGSPCILPTTTLLVGSSQGSVSENIHPVDTQSLTNTNANIINVNHYQFIRSLRFGSYGDDVKKLQEFLNLHNAAIAKSGNGSAGHEIKVFGSKTVQALAKYQKDHGITPSRGIFGAKTMKYINSILETEK